MRPRRPNPQAGFSMVEMLMTAFILAIGILGLTLLQVMSMQSSRGGRSLTTAVQLADRVLDQIELEGRLSWLNITDSTSAPGVLANLNYIGKATIPVADYDIHGDFIGNGLDRNTTPNLYFTVTTTPGAQVGAATIGKLNDYTVRVDFVDATNAQTQAPISRSVTLTRRILHG